MVTERVLDELMVTERALDRLMVTERVLDRLMVTERVLDRLMVTASSAALCLAPQRLRLRSPPAVLPKYKPVLSTFAIM